MGRNCIEVTLIHWPHLLTSDLDFLSKKLSYS